jgi:hypothetical protein
VRNSFLVILCSACVLGQGKTAEPLPLPNCPSLDETLSATRRAIDEGAVLPLGLILDDLLVRGEISEELGSLLGAPDQVTPYLGGNRLRPALGSLLSLVRQRQPTELLGLVDTISGDLAGNQSIVSTLIDFLLASEQRLAVVHPLRRMLIDCGEGRPLARVLADLSAARLSCGIAGSCLLRELAGLAEDPALTEALSVISLEGEEGRKAFGLLVAQLMRSSAQRGFDAEQARALLRQTFVDTLPADSLQRLDRIVGLLGELFADEERRSNWHEVVTCTERHDRVRAVSGMVYDLLIASELDIASLVGRLRQQLADLDVDAIFVDLHGMASILAQDDGLRLPLNALAEPLLTVPVARLLLQTAADLVARGLVGEWSRLATDGLRCDTP